MSTSIAMESFIGHHVTGWHDPEWRRMRGTFDGILEAVERDDPECPCRIRADDGAGVIRCFLAAMYTQPPETLEWVKGTLGLNVLDPYQDLRRTRPDDPWWTDVTDRDGLPIVAA